MAFQLDQGWTRHSRAHLTKPKVLGCYSFDNNEFKSNSLAQLRYFYEPELSPVEFDLNEGFKYTYKNLLDCKSQSIGRILQWITNNSNCVTASPEKDRWLQPHFISNRHAFSFLLNAFYHKPCDWVLCACKYRGSIYLNYSSNRKWKKPKMGQQKLSFSYCGLKIDDFLLTNDPHTTPNASGGIPGEKFVSIYKTGLGHHSLLYSARIVGTSAREVVKDVEELKQTKFIDIKSNYIMKTYKHEYKLRRWKSLNWWSSNILVDSEYIVCGFKDDNGIVRNLKKYTLADLRALGKQHWHPNVCLNFCNSFLSHIQSVVTRDYDECVYNFEYTPGPPCASSQVPFVANMIEFESSSGAFDQYSFLPSWYIEKCNELAA